MPGEIPSGLGEIMPPKTEVNTLRSIEGADTQIQRTDRGLGSYEDIFGPLYKEVKDKVVLDLGSGPTQRFARELEAWYEPKMVVNIDPFAEEEHARHVIKARAEKLPFPDESIDLIYSNNSIPQYLRTRESIIHSLREVIRVLKPDGKANLFPLAYIPIPSQEGEESYPAQYDDDPAFFDEIIKTLLDEYKEAMRIYIQRTGIERPSLINENHQIDARKLLIQKMKSLK